MVIDTYREVLLDDTSFNNLCTHYKDTYDIHLLSIKQRDKFFFFLLLILLLFTLQTFFQDTINSNLQILIAEKWNIYIERTYLFSNILWFLIFGVSIQYYQVINRIEREYDYIHSIEKVLNSSRYPHTIIFTREGENYKKDNSFFANWVWLLYTVFFPLFLLLCILIRIYKDFFFYSFHVGTLITILISLFTVISTVAYMLKVSKKTIICFIKKPTQ